MPTPPKRKPNQKPKSTGISPHTFRHTAATQMARRGVPLYDIAGVLGNSLAMVEKVYAKHCPDRLRYAVNSISPVSEEKNNVSDAQRVLVQPLACGAHTEPDVLLGL